VQRYSKEINDMREHNAFWLLS